MRHKCSNPNCIRRREPHQMVEVLRSEADPTSLGVACRRASCVSAVLEEDRKANPPAWAKALEKPLEELAPPHAEDAKPTREEYLAMHGDIDPHAAGLGLARTLRRLGEAKTHEAATHAASLVLP